MVLRMRIIVGAAALVWLTRAWGAPPVGLEWSAGFPLPPQEDGRAANGTTGVPVAGEHEGVVLLARGSDNPASPLSKGGDKEACADIYALPLGLTNWVRAGTLSRPLTDGMSAATPRGIVCIAGRADGRNQSRVLLLAWDAKRAQAVEKALPHLPRGVRRGAAAAWEHRVYVAGGESDGALTGDVWTLDLDAPQSGWAPLPPLPGPKGRSEAVAFVQNGDQKRKFLYVIGGYLRRADGGRVALTDGYAYDLAQPAGAGVWRAIAPAVPTADGPSAPPAAAWPLISARCVTSGDQHALFFGGLNAEAPVSPERIRGNRNVLAYHTVTDRWFVLGEAPFSSALGCAVAKRSDGSLLLVSDADEAGARAPVCAVGRFVQQRKFHPLNWAVMAVYFFGLAGLGLWFMRKKKSADDFFKGGGRIPWWAAGISIFAAMTSSISFLAVPALAYMSNWQYAPKCFCIILIPPIVIGCYLPFFRKLNLTCAYEYLERRFNLACRLFASLAFILFMVARVAVVAYLPALAVAAATGADVNTCIVIVCLLTILYCATGGIEAVIWSDVVQSAVLAGGTLLLLYLLIDGTEGGLSGVFHIAGRAGKLKMVDLGFDFSQPVIWAVLIGGFIECLISYTSDQCVIQRYMTTSDIREAGRSLWLNVPFLVTGFISFAIGTALYTFYWSQPERLPVTMPKADSVLPLFMANDLPAGAAGIILAGLFAATITSLAANINSSATALTSDWFVRLRQGAGDRAQVRFAQACTVAVGLAGMAGALVLANVDIRSVYDQFLTFIGILTSGLACLFMLGIFTRRVGAAAALTGLVVNYAVCIGLDRTHLAWKPHLLLYGAIGMATCLVTALAVSAVFPNRKKGVESLTWKRGIRAKA